MHETKYLTLSQRVIYPQNHCMDLFAFIHCKENPRNCVLEGQ